MSYPFWLGVWSRGKVGRPSPRLVHCRRLAPFNAALSAQFPKASVSDCEALAYMCRPLKLVDERNCIVRKGDAAALFMGQQLIFAEPELSCPRPIEEQCGW